MMVTIGVLVMLIILVWDGIVIFFLDGDIENLFEEDDWEEPEKPDFPECKHDCELCGSDYCIYECSVYQIWREHEKKMDSRE